MVSLAFFVFCKNLSDKEESEASERILLERGG
jgi:hypothetical protein